MGRCDESSRSEKGVRRRKDLLEVALRLFSENGYDATSIREIAKAAGITEGLIYHYFQGKKDLLKGIVQESGCGDLLEQPDLLESLPLEEAITRIGRCLLENLRERKEIFKLMLAEARLFEKENDSFIPKLIYQNGMLRFGAFLKNRMDRGEIREMEPVLLARQFSGSLVAFFIFQEILLGKTVTDVSPERFLKHLVEVFLTGIRTVPSSGTRSGPL